MQAHPATSAKLSRATLLYDLTEAQSAFADARPISTAPELLGALAKAERMLVAAYGEPSDTSMEGVVAASVIRLVRAIIAKAVQS